MFTCVLSYLVLSMDGLPSLIFIYSVFTFRIGSHHKLFMILDLASPYLYTGREDKEKIAVFPMQPNQS